jgi:hypothetical protein
VAAGASKRKAMSRQCRRRASDRWRERHAGDGWCTREGQDETLPLYHVRISELHSVLKGPKAKDIQVYITMRSMYKGQIRGENSIGSGS